jgi:rRNA maturation endonuclease Nob1
MKHLVICRACRARKTSGDICPSCGAGQKHVRKAKTALRDSRLSNIVMKYAAVTHRC